LTLGASLEPFDFGLEDLGMGSQDRNLALQLDNARQQSVSPQGCQVLG
jgi:hypothetical protein